MRMGHDVDVVNEQRANPKNIYPNWRQLDVGRHFHNSLNNHEATVSLGDTQSIWGSASICVDTVCFVNTVHREASSVVCCCWCWCNANIVGSRKK